MNMKTVVAAVCLVLLCSAAIVCISDDSDADASAMDTITVSTGEELVSAIRSTYIMSGDTPVPAPKNIIVANGVDTIHINDTLFDSYCASPYFFGTFDGNGCTISADVSGWKCIIDEIHGSSTLKNFHIKVENGEFMLAFGTKNATVLLENIVLDKYVTCGGNTSAFMSQMWGASDVTFRNCVNNASYTIEGYAGVFLGGYPVETSTALTFDGCVNNGNITGDKVFMFVGNDAHKGGVITVSNCVNNGTFRGNYAAPFANFNSDNKYADLNVQYIDAVGGVFESTSLDESSSYDSSTGVVRIGTVDGRIYDVSMMAYARSAEGSTYGMTVTIPYTVGDTKVGWFVDKFTAVSKYGLELEEFPSGVQYPYQKVVRNNEGNNEVFFVFDMGDTYEWSMDARPRVTFKAYADGAFIGVGSSTGTLNAPTGVPSYTVTIPRSDCYTVDITSGGNVVRSGTELKFSVIPSSGFTITSVSMSVGDESTILTPTDGIYTYTVNSNAEIVVSYSQISYLVTYNLVNVSSDNSQDVVIAGASFQAVLTPADGYDLGTIYVTYGSETYTIDGSDVLIPAVNGNIVITCIGTLAADAPGYTDDEDDDDDGPMTPGQTVQVEKSKDDNTTTVVACAAAAVAAAMIAAFLLIDGRKP